MRLAQTHQGATAARAIEDGSAMAPIVRTKTNAQMELTHAMPTQLAQTLSDLIPALATPDFLELDTLAQILMSANSRPIIAI